MLYVVHSKTDEVVSTWGACLGHVKCHFTVNRTSLVSVFECFIMQICFNFVFMFTKIVHSCADVFMLSRWSSLYCYKASFAFLSSPSHMHVHCNKCSHINQVCVGILSQAFPSSCMSLQLQPISYGNLTTQYTAISKTQHDEQGTFEHGLFSNVDILQCGAKWFDEGCHITLKACNLHVWSK